MVIKVNEAMTIIYFTVYNTVVIDSGDGSFFSYYVIDIQRKL